ncbi:MAG: hypothetical protein WC554_09110 [Clostridia bacterium]|jgi:hypothetical protein
MKIYFLDDSAYWSAKFYKTEDIAGGIIDCKQVIIDGYFEQAILNPICPVLQNWQKSLLMQPESIWACKSLQNWTWILLLGMFLCTEYHFRFDIVSPEVLFFRWCYFNPPNLPQSLNRSKFPEIMEKKYGEKENRPWFTIQSN